MHQAPESETSRLLALHQTVLQAHLQGDIELLLQDEPDDYVIASRGTVSHPDKAARRQRLGAYLAATHFDTYRDETPPVVTVSADGTLGWVIVQVYAQGQQTAVAGTTTPLEFVSAWIELYEKRDGRWLRIGNVSNFKP